MLRSFFGSLPLLTVTIQLASPAPAAARTGCDAYDRCFEFSGTDDALSANGGRTLRERFEALHVPHSDDGREED